MKTNNDTAIVFCVDKNYIKYCSVAVLSLLIKGQIENPHIFILFVDDIDESEIHKFSLILSTFQGNFEIIKITEHDFDHLSTSGRYTIAAYFRILLPKMLRDYKKILYLDSDILVINSLRDLLNLNLEKYPIAAASDLLAARTCKMEIFRLGEKHYFNSGVLLINTDIWNLHRITERCVEVANDDNFRENIVYPDQCILNYLIQGQFKELDARFNTFVYIDPSTNASRYVPTPDVNKLEQYSIIHFVGSIKPWHSGYSIREFQELYHSFTMISPWRKEIENQMQL